MEVDQWRVHRGADLPAVRPGSSVSSRMTRAGSGVPVAPSRLTAARRFSSRASGTPAKHRAPSHARQRFIWLTRPSTSSVLSSGGHRALACS